MTSDTLLINVFPTQQVEAREGQVAETQVTRRSVGLPVGSVRPKEVMANDSIQHKIVLWLICS